MRAEMVAQWRRQQEAAKAPAPKPQRRKVRGRIALVGQACGTLEAWLEQAEGALRWACRMREGEGRALRVGDRVQLEGRFLHAGTAYASMADCVVVPSLRPSAQAVAA